MPAGTALAMSTKVWPSPAPKSNTWPPVGTLLATVVRSTGTKRSR